MQAHTPIFDQQRTYSSQNLSLSAQESRYSLDINKRIFPDSREVKTSLDWRTSNRIFKAKLQEIIQKTLKNKQGNQIQQCGKAVKWLNSNVDVFYHVDSRKVIFSNILDCRKGWTCPRCASRLAAQKKAELLQLQKVVRNEGLHAYLMTLTIPHSLKDNLSDLLERLSRVQSKFTDALRGKKWKRIFPKNGHITVLEITYSASFGWHPHLHVLVISEQYYTDKEIKTIEKELYETWSAKCQISGVQKPHKKFGVKLQNCASEVERLDTKVIHYLVKHGFINEIDERRIEEKMTHGESLTIWEIALLSQHVDQHIARKYGLILREYTRSMVNKHFIRWSELLTDYLKNKGYDFKDRAVQKVKKQIQKQVWLAKRNLVAQIDHPLWLRICRKPYVLQHQLLQSIELDIKYGIAECRIYPRTDRLLKYIRQSKLYD